MPGEVIKNLKATMATAMDGQDVTQLALMQAMSGMADAMARMMSQHDQAARDIREIGTTMHSVDKRLAVIESSSVSAEVEVLKREMRDSIAARLNKLELTDSEQQGRDRGQSSILDGIAKYGPVLVSIIVAIVMLTLMGRLKFG